MSGTYPQCRFLDKSGICRNHGNRHFAETVGLPCGYECSCGDWEAEDSEEEPKDMILSPEVAKKLMENTEQLGRYIMQMGQLIGQMQRRMDEMEARQTAVTISHADVKRIQARIRARADEICRKNNLQDKDSPRIFRAAIKKDVLKRHQVKDLHDLKAAALSGAETQIDRWTDIRLLMERRVST